MIAGSALPCSFMAHENIFYHCAVSFDGLFYKSTTKRSGIKPGFGGWLAVCKQPGKPQVRLQTDKEPICRWRGLFCMAATGFGHAG